MSTIPVVLFAYRRPDLLARTLESLRANRIPLLYAFSDGPRDVSVETEVAEVRRLLHAVDWTKTIIVEQPTNIGVGESELRGISRVLAEHEAMIAVEDDLEFGPGAYDFLCAGLERYRYDTRVMGVTGWNHPKVTPPDITSQPYFSGRFCALLWGTWRRAWGNVGETTAAELTALCAMRGIDIAAYGGDLRAAAAHELEYGQWDLRYNLHMLAERGLMLYPARSMVAHIGYDARATNSPRAGEWVDTPEPAPAIESVQWPAVAEHPANAALWRRAGNPPPRPALPVRVVRKLSRVLSTSVLRLGTVAPRVAANLRLELLRDRIQRTASGGIVHVGGRSFRVNDGKSAWLAYQDAFVRGYGAFASASDAPAVIDCGAKIGMFTLAALRSHPSARIVAFEADTSLFTLLRENVDLSGAKSSVTLVNAGLGGTAGSDRLSRYVQGEIAFLRIDIDSGALELLRDLEANGRLQLVREVAIWYRMDPASEQWLGGLLTFLETSGFRYTLHEHDDDVGGESSVRNRAPRAGVVFAQRRDAASGP